MAKPTIWISQINRFLKYYFSAKTSYQVHSPFLFAFTENCLEDDRLYYAFLEIEHLRRLMRKERSLVQVTELGAGTQFRKKKNLSIRQIARRSALHPFWGKILFKMINHFQPENILELGTSLGISTLYLSKANSGIPVHTIEGCPNTAKLARQHFKMLEAQNITLHEGVFEEKLPEVLNSLNKLDFAFFDGDHQKAPTLSYFNQCLTKSHDQTIIIIADIHWSKEMESAWKEIKAHPLVTLSVDLFTFGIVFFNDDLKEKFDISLIRNRWKPWNRTF